MNAQKARLFIARVGTSAFAAASSADGIALDTVSGALVRTTNFKFVEDVIELNLGTGMYSGKSAFPVSFQVYINGILLRPVMDGATKIKTFESPASVSFAGTAGEGDYVFYRAQGVPPAFATGKIHFGFALKTGDEIQVRYNNG
jgi:hypothetical protein